MAVVSRRILVASAPARQDVADLAQELGSTVNQVCFLEFGLVTPRELSERSLRACARTLGAPDLYEQFRERFEQ